MTTDLIIIIEKVKNSTLLSIFIILPFTYHPFLELPFCLFSCEDTHQPLSKEFLSEVKQGLLKSEEIAGRIDLRFSYLLTFKTDWVFILNKNFKKHLGSMDFYALHILYTHTILSYIKMFLSVGTEHYGATISFNYSKF